MGMKVLAAKRRDVQGMANRNDSGGAARTKPKSAEGDDRLRKVVVSLPADTPVALSSMRSDRDIWRVIHQRTLQ